MQAWGNFYLIESDDDLRSLLAAPLATWIAFLHPSQKRLSTGSFNGPVKITGAAGTGKTVVAMHRARHLARQGKKVLLLVTAQDW
jgi:superfamily I DNA and RNA helicase